MIQIEYYYSKAIDDQIEEAESLRLFSSIPSSYEKELELLIKNNTNLNNEEQQNIFSRSFGCNRILRQKIFKSDRDDVNLFEDNDFGESSSRYYLSYMY